MTGRRVERGDGGPVGGRQGQGGMQGGGQRVPLACSTSCARSLMRFIRSSLHRRSSITSSIVIS